MAAWVETLLILLTLTNLTLVAMSRLGACIRTVALQGIVLGLLTICVHPHTPSLYVLLLAGGSIGLKSVVFPLLLGRAMRDTHIRHEIEPFVGYGVSILVAALALPVSFWLGSRLPLPRPASTLIVPLAFHAILTGLFLIVSRRKAITQVLGYLVLENGIYTFGICLVQESTLLVELGVLLDIFVAVFVMGITIFHINQEFNHIDTDRLSALRD
ncbi:MAG: hydrogenase [Planctomycetes bacterium]|nr:hydrogenase [Planctomycetota bacterium]